jgi:hypothetical protein
VCANECRAALLAANTVKRYLGVVVEILICPDPRQVSIGSQEYRKSKCLLVAPTPAPDLLHGDRALAELFLVEML